MIVEAALGVVADGRADQLTIRGLAADLGVAPMSLYNHVRDKEDLLDEVVDRLLGTSWRPKVPESDWREWVMQAADRFRRFLVGQSAALRVYLQHPVVSPNALERMQAMKAVLLEALGDEGATRKAYAAIHTYTIGFAALEASRSASPPPREHRGHLADRLAAYGTPQQFKVGLGYLLDGIVAQQMVNSRNGSRTSARRG